MRALITGITGQDGSYLAEFLLDKGYEVYGIVRRSSLEKFDRIEAITEKIRFVEGDLTDQSSLDQALQQLKPDELYNLAAQSFVPVSWNQPVLTADVTGLGALRVMEAIRKHSPTNQISTGFKFGNVWQGSGKAANGNHAFSSPQPVRCGQDFWAPHHGQLS